MAKGNRKEKEKKQAMRAKCIEVVRQDRKYRPWVFIAMLELIVVLLLAQWDKMPQALELPVLTLSVAFGAVVMIRFKRNLNCPICGESLLSRQNKPRPAGLRPSKACVCHQCKARIPFDEV